MSIPAGYEKSSDQSFGDFDEAIKLINNYCKRCSGEISCKFYNSLTHAMGNNYPIWDKNYLVKIHKQDDWMDKKVHCKKVVIKESLENLASTVKAE